jgi:microcystin degradation protein MlrC
VVACGTDATLVHDAARKLASRLWDARKRFRFGVDAGTVDECLRKAAESTARPVVVSDSGDNPTAGGAGDVPYVLERLLEQRASRVLYASIADPAAVARCRQVGIDGEVTLSLGGKLDPLHGTPVTVRARVRAIAEPGPQQPANAQVVVHVEGVEVIVTERRTPFHRLDDFTRLGLDPHEYQTLVVKIGYLEPELKRLARTSLLALSPGAVSQDLASLPYRRLRRPLYPLDPETTWAPTAGNV